MRASSLDATDSALCHLAGEGDKQAPSASPGLYTNLIASLATSQPMPRPRS
jgi:hypothetical protein